MRVRSVVTALSLLAAGLSPIIAGSTTAPTDVAGVPASNIGLHGPLQDHAVNLELVGHSPIPTADGTPLGNNGGLALIDECAYIGRWHDYSGRTPIQILDVSDPSEPTVIGGVPGSANPGGVAREIRAVDVAQDAPGPLNTIQDLLIVMEFSQATGNRTNNKIRFFNFPSGDCREPVLAGTFDMRAFRGHEFFVWMDPTPVEGGSICIEGCWRVLVFVTAPVTTPNVMVIDASDPTNPLLVGTYDAGQPLVSTTEVEGTALGNYAHSISVSADGSTAYLSYWDGGFFTMDARAFENALLPAGGTLLPRGAASIPHDYSGPEGDQYGNTHSAVPIPGTDSVVVGDEIYITTDGCPFGWLRVLDIGDATTPPSQIGEFRLAENEPENCVTVDPGDPVLGGAHRAANVRNSAGTLIDGTFSMHNQTVSDHFVYTSWYGGGLRVIDVSDPTAPVEAGAFVPKPVETTATVPNTPAPTYGRDADPTNDWWVAMWSYPVIRDGLIYVNDVRNGLYILRPAPNAPFAEEVASIGFLEGNSTLGDPFRRASAQPS